MFEKYESRFGQTIANVKEIASREGFKINVRASHTKLWDYNAQYYPSVPKEVRDLDFILSDDDTNLRVHDVNADGIGEGDELIIAHRFKSGELLQVSITYCEKGDFRIYSCIRSSRGENEISHTSINTVDLDFLTHYVVGKKIAPVIEWGRRLYSDLVDCTSRNEAPDLSYSYVKRALSEVEKLLPQIKEGTKYSEDALLNLSKGYVRLAKERKERSAIIIPGTKVSRFK